MQPAGLERDGERLSGAEQMALADDVAELARAQPFGQRASAAALSSSKGRRCEDILRLSQPGWTRKTGWRPAHRSRSALIVALRYLFWPEHALVKVSHGAGMGPPKERGVGLSITFEF